MTSVPDRPVPSIAAPGRRAVLVAGATGLGAAGLTLSACSSGGGSVAVPSDTGTPGQVLGKVSDVPVGGALYVEASNVILTQQQAGTVKCLSAVCTHEGCSVSLVQGSDLVCPCHNSTFDLSGAVLKGPATSPLADVPVTVNGDEVLHG